MFTRLQRLSSRRTAFSSQCKYTTAVVPLLPTPLEPDAPIKPPVLKPSKKAKYDDLEAYLSNTVDSRVDTIYRGTKYEYIVQSSLTRLGFDLTHYGGSSDKGIDLLGTWTPPSSSTSIKIIIQCKGLKKHVLPKVVRELEGTFSGAPFEWRRKFGVIAFLATTMSATKGVRDALGRSLSPMGFVCCDAEGRLLQMLWNRRAEEEGLMGVGVCVRYPGEDERCRVIDLTWKGEPVGEGTSQKREHLTE